MGFRVQDIIDSIAFLNKNIDFAGRSDEQPVYVGFSLPGTKESAGVLAWAIMKVTYSANGNATRVRFANGSVLMDKDWAQRTTYDYTN